MYICRRLKKLALPIHSQLFAGIAVHNLRSAYIFEKRSSLHSLRALSDVFGLSSFGLVSERNKKQYVLLSLTYPFVEFVVSFGNILKLINLVSYVPITVANSHYQPS